MIRKKLLIRMIFTELAEQSKRICGDTSLKESLYLDMLKDAGIRTYKIPIPQRNLEAFKKKSKFTAFKVIKQNIVVNNQLYAVVELSEIGLSDMTADQILQIRKGEKYHETENCETENRAREASEDHQKQQNEN